MTYGELLAEIERVKTAISATKSPFLRKDYGKHLKKLEKEKKQYGKQKNHSL